MTAPPATRRTLSQPTAYALVGAIIGLALFASSTPSPLYGIYRQLWGFSPLVLTLVYATYAIGIPAASCSQAACRTRSAGAPSCSSP